MLLTLVAGCGPAGAELGGSTALIAEDMVPDPTYHPRVGDRALLYAIEGGTVMERVPLLKDVTAYDIYARCVQARDAERLLELNEHGWLQWAVPGTRVSVLSVLDRNHTGGHMALEVRVVETGSKNAAVWTSSNYVNRMVHKEPE